MTTEDILSQKLDRLIAALERIAPPEAKTPDLDAADCFVWAPERLTLDPVSHVNRVDIALIRGVDLVRDQLVDNTRRFAKGFPANNVLLWGARGMGKSSLVKAAQASVNAEMPDRTPLKLIEIHREDIDSLPTLMNLIKETDYRFILFCDDLSFDHDDTSYKSLKAALEGGVEGRPGNVIFYATSNRRHLMPRDMIDNERSTAINPSEAIEEKYRFQTVSVSGLASTNAARTIISPWSTAMRPILSWLTIRPRCTPKRWNGPRHAETVRDVLHGNISRIWQVASGLSCKTMNRIG